MNRSKEGAEEELEKVRAEVVASVRDDAVSALLTDDLLRTVLESAWKHQFDDDRTPFRSEVQQIVSDAIETRFLAG